LSYEINFLLGHSLLLQCSGFYCSTVVRIQDIYPRIHSGSCAHVR
jgi:hypothetical protein